MRSVRLAAALRTLTLAEAFESLDRANQDPRVHIEGALMAPLSRAIRHDKGENAKEEKTKMAFRTKDVCGEVVVTPFESNGLR